MTITDFNAASQAAEGDASFTTAAHSLDDDLDSLASILAADVVSAKKWKTAGAAAFGELGAYGFP